MISDRAELERACLADLEQLFCHQEPLVLPKQGTFTGKVLGTVEHHQVSASLVQRLTTYLFSATPFGISFRSSGGTWFFYRPQWEMGAFTPSLKTSRWRETEVIALEYEISRLPFFVRNFLYDELKPLSPDLLLGLGGMNLAPDRISDFFFFYIQRIKD